MREIRALIWKEWSETRLFLWIGLSFFIGLPIAGGLESTLFSGHRFEFFASPWIFICAGVLAIVVGVAGTCRDLQTKLEDFWTSRPMGGMRLFIIKYLVGNAIVLLACIIPLVIEWMFGSLPESTEAAMKMSFLWIAIFSIAFAAGCLFRKPAQAATVSVAATLLLLFLPLLFPPLQKLGFWQAVNSSTQSQCIFAAGMLLLGSVFGVLGVMMVRLHWQIESGRPLIYAAIAIAFLLLIESASYQLGTNLAVVQQINLPKDQIAAAIDVHDFSGSVQIARAVRNGSTTSDDMIGTRSLSIGSDSIALSELSRFQPTWTGGTNRFVVSKRDPSVIYSTTWTGDTANNSWSLTVSRWNGGKDNSVIPLWQDRGWRYSIEGNASLYQWSDRLFVMGKRSMVFDISDPVQPKKIADEPVDYRIDWDALSSSRVRVLALPPAPGLPKEEKLKFLAQLGNVSAFDGDIWARVNFGSGKLTHGVTLDTLRLRSLTDDHAEFELVGQYQPTFVQAAAGAQWFKQLTIKNGMLFCVCQNTLVEVFQIDRNGPLKLIAHFAVPGMRCFVPMDDGRSIAGGDGRLWLLAAPGKR